MTPADPMISRAQDSLRHRAATIAGGVGGASIIALLATSAVFAPAIAGGVTVSTIMVWLSSLGANALASWLDQWAQGKLGSLNRADPDAEHRLLEQCASALTIALSADKALADDIELVVQSTGAIKTTLEALEDQGEDQARLLNNLLADLLSLSVENRHLHQALLQAVHDQARSILATQAQGDAALATKLQEILAATQSAQRPAPTTGALPRLQPKEISAQVVQHIAISGGSVGSVIGKQINHHTPSSPQADESASPGSDHAE